ncbi:hypothetical protein B0H13DRAFT_1858939 [Mycena leptocephala]|nr:hypothetical protein B0H13DRAFT_1858939 [Mycena leptocephala]
MTERRRSNRLNSNPRAERYDTRSLRNMITELHSNRRRGINSLGLSISNCGRAAWGRLPQQKYVVLRDSSALITNNKMVPGAEFTETAIKREYRLALGRVCSEPERDAASVEIEWKDNEKERLPVLLFSAKGARHVAIGLENKKEQERVGEPQHYGDSDESVGDRSDSCPLNPAFETDKDTTSPLPYICPVSLSATSLVQINGSHVCSLIWQ